MEYDFLTKPINSHRNEAFWCHSLLVYAILSEQAYSARQTI